MSSPVRTQAMAVAPCLPEVGEQSREAKRSDRLGKKRDGQITHT